MEEIQDFMIGVGFFPPTIGSDGAAERSSSSPNIDFNLEL